MRCNKYGAKTRCQSCSALCLLQIERVEAAAVRSLRAQKRRLLLALRPPKLSRSGTEHITEMTRQMTLVAKAHSKRNFR